MALRSRGHEVFFDRDDLPPGESYHDQIASAIACCHLVVFVISEKAVSEGRYTLSELEMVRKRWPNPSRRVLPVLIDSLPLDQIPAYLKEVTLLEPSGNVAADVAAKVDSLGWRGLDQSAIKSASATFFLLLAITTLAVMVLKQEYFDCWTWLGAFSELSSLSPILGAAVPFLAFLWGIARLRSKYDLIGRGVASIFDGWAAAMLLVVLLATCIGLISILVLRAPVSCSTRLERIVADQNWSLAESELTQLNTMPLKKEISDTLQIFVSSAASAARYEYPPVNLLRQHRASLKLFLEQGQDYQNLNSVSFANNARSIFFQEDDPEILVDAIARLDFKISEEKKPISKGILYQKKGELHLANGEVEMCQEAIESALELLPEGPIWASAQTNIGHTYAIVGEIEKAIEKYELAEPYYPEGQRFLFYSNFGYLHTLAEQFTEAEEKIRRALRIKSDDWVSLLNLGLLYEKMDRHADSALAFRKVISDAPPDIDASREARLLLARILEISGASEYEILAASLSALERSSEVSAIERIASAPSLRADLYRDLADAMKRIDTHGIDEYIQWFEEREVATRNLP